MNPIGVDRLQSQLLTSGLSQKDQPLYQVISQLIGYVRQLISETQGSLDVITGGGAAPGQTYLTAENELSSLPNSRRLVAGNGVHFNNDGQRIIIGAAPIPGSGELGEEGPMGVPGIQGPIGPIGPTGPSGSGSGMPFGIDSYEESYEYPALISLLNGNSIPENAIQDGTLLARNASNETISGQWQFTNPIISISAVTPQFIFIDTSGAVDQKYTRVIFTGGSMVWQNVNDIFSVFSTIFSTTRTGVTANAFVLPIALTINSQSSVAITSDQTAWNPTGLGSTFYFLVTPSAAWTIRGITAQPVGTIIYIRNNSANILSIAHEDGAASGANRIWTPTGIGIGIGQFSSITFYYDGLVGRWIVMNWT